MTTRHSLLPGSEWPLRTVLISHATGTPPSPRGEDQARRELDRRDAGGGSTSASTAMLQYEIDELLVDLGGAIGVEAAAVAYRECSRGIDLVEQATQTVGHNCGFRRSPSVFMAIRQRDVGVLRPEREARAAAGFGVQVLDGDELEDRWISSGAPPSNRSRADPSTPTPCATGHSNRQRSGMHRSMPAPK